MLVKELFEEFKTVTSGKTFDALLPPLVFLVINSFFGLNPAVILSLGLAALLGSIRLLRNQTWYYALGGLLAVAAASGLAILTRSAAGYFIPSLISSTFLLLLAVSSLLAGKPLAAWASHLTRGWPVEWFWRQDIKPAYREVTIVWSVFFALRLIIQIILFRAGDAARLGWTSTLLGWPVTVVVLVFSYIYGIWRLRSLGGPGVQEFQAGKEPPWEGQKRGF